MKLFIEPANTIGLDRRVFRRMECGALEWAHYADWQAHGERSRFYGFASRDLPAACVEWSMERELLGKEYAEIVGYNPFQDDPSISVDEVRQTLAELKALHAQPAPVPEIVARMLAMPKTHRVIVTYQDGATRHHDVATAGQAENYARGERRKIGRDLINRETGATVRVVSVDIIKI